MEIAGLKTPPETGVPAIKIPANVSPIVSPAVFCAVGDFESPAVSITITKRKVNNT